MTLYWYVHWFWITYCASAVLADVTTNSTEQPIYGEEGNYSLGKLKSLKKHLLINVNNTEVNESVIESDISSNYNSTTLLSLSSDASNRSDVERIENLTSYYEATCNNHSEIVLSSEQGNLSAAGITGITLSCVFVVGILMVVSYVLYKNRGFNRPQVLNDHCSNLDSSGYIDDTSDNSEEMYSLDNDSFLNSLEAMTIQNYWTDSVKHTKL